MKSRNNKSWFMWVITRWYFWAALMVSLVYSLINDRFTSYVDIAIIQISSCLLFALLLPTITYFAKKEVKK